MLDKKRCMNRETLTEQEKERGAAAKKLKGSLESSELRCFGFVDFTFVCISYNHFQIIGITYIHCTYLTFIQVSEINYNNYTSFNGARTKTIPYCIERNILQTPDTRLQSLLKVGSIRQLHDKNESISMMTKQF